MNHNSSFIFNKTTLDNIEYISNDMMYVKNPMKYYNRLFNNHLNTNFVQMQNLFDQLTLKLLNITNQYTQNNSNNLLNQLVKNKTSIKWTNTTKKNMEFPHIYNAIIELFKKNNKPIMSFEKFNDLYNKKIIKITDFDDYLNNYLNNQFTNLFNNFTLNGQQQPQENITDEIINILKYFENGTFISLDVKQYVETNINCCDIYDFEHLKLYFFTSDKNMDKTNINIIKHIVIISKWIHSLNPVYKIKFVYFDCPIPKKLNRCLNIQSHTHEQQDLHKDDKNYKYLSSQNINSGSSSSNNMLMIWRREEFTKVLIHELIHYLDMDVKYDDNFNKLFSNIGSINYPILVNETITEIQAQFLNTIYITGQLKNNNFDTFKTLYQFEHIFSWYQFAKIMEYYEIEKFKKKYIIEKFNQSTNAFSYYILKSILGLNFATILLSLNHFIKLIQPTQPTQLIQPTRKIQCNVNKCNPLVKHIIKTLTNPKKIIKFLNKVIKRLEFFDETLRMTIFNIEI